MIPSALLESVISHSSRLAVVTAFYTALSTLAEPRPIRYLRVTLRGSGQWGRKGRGRRIERD